MVKKPNAVLEKRPVLKQQLMRVLVGAFLVIGPVAVIAQALGHAQKLIQKAIAPIKKVIPDVTVGGVSMYTIAAFLLVILFCWLIGWFAMNTTLGKQLHDWVRATFLRRTPLYKKLQKRKEAQEDEEEAEARRPALIRITESWQPGVILDERTDDWLSVYIPDIPSGATGSVHILRKSQALPVDIPLEQFRTMLQAEDHGVRMWLDLVADAQGTA